MGRIILAFLLLLVALPAEAQYLPADPGTLAPSDREGRVTTEDGRYRVNERVSDDLGILVPDLDGNYVLIPGGERPDPDPEMLEAQELKLKVRELAAQLLETWPNTGLTGIVAMPTSFVSQDDLNQSNSLGRYLGETMFYEFNTRGFPTREYRAEAAIQLLPGTGEIALSRSLTDRQVSGDWAAILVGTMYRDRYAVFVNARLIRASDGLVLRTGQVILPMNDLIRRMTIPPPPQPVYGAHPFTGVPFIPGSASSSSAGSAPSASGGLRIVQGPR